MAQGRQTVRINACMHRNQDDIDGMGVALTGVNAITGNNGAHAKTLACN